MKFIFKKELEWVKKKHGICVFTKEPCAALVRKTQLKNKLDERPNIIIKSNNYKLIICVKRKKQAKFGLCIICSSLIYSHLKIIII